LGVAKIAFGKESINELCALLGSNVRLFPQNVTNEGQRPLQKLEIAPFHNIELGILDMAFIEGVKITVQLTEIIDAWEFWE
jgi:hypothetical protein